MTAKKPLRKTTKIDELRKDLEDLKFIVDLRNKQLTQAEKENDTAAADNRKLADELEALRKENAQLRMELTEAEDEAVTLQNKLEGRTEALARIVAIAGDGLTSDL